MKSTFLTIATAVLATLSASCESDRTFDCTAGSSGECVRSGLTGTCLAPGHCAFSDSSCNDGLRWDSTAAGSLSGECVTVGDSETNACQGTAKLTGLPGAACGVCDSGTYSCDGTEAVECEGEFTLEQNITGEGSPNASSIFSGSFAPNLSIDGDLGTSWFSKGPGTDSPESVYSWLNSESRCIQSITIVGNGNHDTTQFQEGFGFEQVTVEVRDDAENVIYSKVESLNGNPDPTVTVMPEGVFGRSVHLRLTGHESTDCGGFSELTVNALL